MAETNVRALALREQYATEQQQKGTSEIAMWLFLATEIMFFGGLFAAYSIYRVSYPAAFLSGSRDMNIVLGAINTAVLLCSSFTMALAVRSSQVGEKRALVGFLILTMVLGAVFLSIKFTEYYLHYQHHKFPGASFRSDFSEPGEEQIFFLLYFIMTGLHATHMFVGIGLLITLVIRAARGVFTPEYHTPVEITGLYWHFVDVIWLFLFALLYLIGLRH